MEQLPTYSFLMSVYAKEESDYLRFALKSMVEQTCFPGEIVVVKDGPLTNDLEDVLKEYDFAFPGLLKYVEYENNQGLGYALSQGIVACSNELVARMDSDDYSTPNRMEVQLSEFKRDENLDMLGSQVTEFIDSLDNVLSVSKLPLFETDILKYSKRRNPFRHTPMVYKKSKVLAAGNYSSSFLYFEDWDLFNRMISQGCRGRNVDQSLVFVRATPDFFSRRGGTEYLRYIWKFKREQLRRGYFSFGDFCASFFPHAAVCLMPNSLRSFVYTNLLRKKTNNA